MCVIFQRYLSNDRAVICFPISRQLLEAFTFIFIPGWRESLQGFREVLHLVKKTDEENHNDSGVSLTKGQ